MSRRRGRQPLLISRNMGRGSNDLIRSRIRSLRVYSVHQGCSAIRRRMLVCVQHCGYDREEQQSQTGRVKSHPRADSTFLRRPRRKYWYGRDTQAHKHAYNCTVYRKLCLRGWSRQDTTYSVCIYMRISCRDPSRMTCNACLHFE